MEDNNIFRNFAPMKNTGSFTLLLYVKFPKIKETQLYTNSISTLCQLYTNAMVPHGFFMGISRVSHRYLMFLIDRGRIEEALRKYCDWYEERRRNA